MRQAAIMLAARSPTTRTALSCFRIIETGAVAPPALIRSATRQTATQFRGTGRIFAILRTIPAACSPVRQFSFFCVRARTGFECKRVQALRETGREGPSGTSRSDDFMQRIIYAAASLLLQSQPHCCGQAVLWGMRRHTCATPRKRLAQPTRLKRVLHVS